MREEGGRGGEGEGEGEGGRSGGTCTQKEEGTGRDGKRGGREGGREVHVQRKEEGMKREREEGREGASSLVSNHSSSPLQVTLHLTFMKLYSHLTSSTIVRWCLCSIPLE